jgi:DNA-binding LacI/PurR family transcriptional regulator
MNAQVLPTAPRNRIACVAPTFLSTFQAHMSEYLKMEKNPIHELAMESITDEVDVQTRFLLRILSRKPLPLALITISVRPANEIITAYKNAGIPVVLIDEEAVGAAMVAADNFVGGHIAGNYLAKKGLKRLAVVSGRTGVSGGYNAKQRVEGFRSALVQNGLKIADGGRIEIEHYSEQEGEDLVPFLAKNGFDGVFVAAGDSCARGMVRGARRNGLSVPENLALVGYDGLMAAEVCYVPLTTVKQPLREMAAAAIRMAVTDRMETLKNPKRMVYKPELVVRRSA